MKSAENPQSYLEFSSVQNNFNLISSEIKNHKIETILQIIIPYSNQKKSDTTSENKKSSSENPMS